MCVMCGCGEGEFMGVSLSAPNTVNVGPSEMPSPEMFNTDSINNLGVSKSEMDMN